MVIWLTEYPQNQKWKVLKNSTFMGGPQRCQYIVLNVLIAWR